MSCFKVDNIDFTHAVVDRPKRKFSILDGDNSGRQIITAKMERDILGTFYNYTLEIDTSFMTRQEYDTLYYLLSAPVDSHTLEIPFAQETLVFDAYVTSGEDELIRIDSDKNYWGKLSINFVAMEPQRRPTTS